MASIGSSLRSLQGPKTQVRNPNGLPSELKVMLRVVLDLFILSDVGCFLVSFHSPSSVPQTLMNRTEMLMLQGRANRSIDVMISTRVLTAGKGTWNVSRRQHVDQEL